MANFNLIVLFLMAITSALAYELYQDENGQYYYIIPLSSPRQKRAAPKPPKPEIKVGGAKVSASGPPARLNIHYEGKIFEDKNHLVKGATFHSHPVFNNPGPAKSGGKLEYNHKKSGSGFGLTADHTRHFGTDVNFQGKYNLVQKKNFGLDLTQQYSKHFGRGNGAPGWGTFLNAHANFD